MPERSDTSDFAVRIAALLRSRACELTLQWLKDIRARIPSHPHRVFPGETLLNRIPEIIQRLSLALTGKVPAESLELVHKELAMLAELRRAQGYGLEEVMLELEMLREVLFHALVEDARQHAQDATPQDIIETAYRLQNIVGQMMHAMADLFRTRSSAEEQSRAQLLARFGRALTHELRNRLSVALLVVQRLRLQEQTSDPRLLETLEQNLHRIEPVVSDVFGLLLAQGGGALGTGRCPVRAAAVSRSGRRRGRARRASRGGDSYPRAGTGISHRHDARAHDPGQPAGQRHQIQ